MHKIVSSKLFIDFEDLKVVFGTKRASNLKDLLARNKVSFFVDVDGRPFTTMEAINAALGVGSVKLKSNDGFNIEHLNV